MGRPFLLGGGTLACRRPQRQPPIYRAALGLALCVFGWVLLAAGAPTIAIAWNHGETPPAVVCTFKTGNCAGVGGGSALFTAATCNGVADDSAAASSFAGWVTGTFQVAHPGLLVGLDLGTSGTCRIVSTTVRCGTISPSFNVSCPWNGISKLRIVGYGVTLDMSGADSLAGQGIPAGATFISVRTASANAGDTCVTVNTNADGSTPINFSNFAVGRYVSMTGFDLQGLWQGGGFGYPPNLFENEYHKVTSLNTGTPGQVCFDAPLRHTYKSTWPLYDKGGVNGVGDNGGPATLYALDPAWDTEIEYRGVTIPDRSGVSTSYNTLARKLVLRDVTLTGTLCVTPTQTEETDFVNVTAAGCNGSGNGVEVDKQNNIFNVTGGSQWGYSFPSSTGAEVFNITNTTITNCISGTPRKFVGTNVRFTGTCGSPAWSWQLGAAGYGRTDEVICTGCEVGTLTAAGVFNKGWHDGGVNLTYTMSAGVITIPNTLNGGTNPVINQERSFPVGTNLFWRNISNYTEGGVFQVNSVDQDATNTYIHTSSVASSGNFPTTLPLDSGKLYVNVHPAPKFTCTSCTSGGIPVFVGWPAAAPYGSFNVVNFAGTQGATPSFVFNAFGNVSSISINVTRASTAGSLSFLLAQSSNVAVDNNSMAEVNYGPIVDAKVVGNRVINLSGVTNGKATDCSGGGFAACLPLPDSTTSWLSAYNSGAAFSGTDTGGQALVTVTIQTNQGVVNPP